MVTDSQSLAIWGRTAFCALLSPSSVFPAAHVQVALSNLVSKLLAFYLLTRQG